MRTPLKGLCLAKRPPVGLLGAALAGLLPKIDFAGMGNPVPCPLIHQTKEAVSFALMLL
jgi:hypothetical protein